MRRVACAALSGILLAGCKIERTPQEYIDPRDPVVQARETSAETLNTRLGVLREALERGDVQTVQREIRLAPDVYVATDLDREVIRGASAVRAELGDFLSRAGPVRLHDVQITVAPRGSAAWFRSEVERVDGGGEPSLRITGLLIRPDRGSGWELVQAHVSGTAAPRPGTGD